VYTLLLGMHKTRISLRGAKGMHTSRLRPDLILTEQGIVWLHQSGRLWLQNQNRTSTVECVGGGSTGG
jgi:hypothetical protein